jgi:PKD repeat protein
MQLKFYFDRFFLILCFLLPSFILAQSPLLPQRYVPNKLIVKIKQSATTNGRIEAAESILRNQMNLREVKGVFREPSPSFQSHTYQNNLLKNYYEVEISQEESLTQAIARLKAQSWVEHVEPLTYFETLSPPFRPNDRFFVEGRLWGLEKAQVPEAWEISKGDSNIVIAVIDDYIWAGHPEFQGQLKYNHKERYGLRGVDDDGNGFIDDSLGYDFAQNNFALAGWHGSAVAGVAAAKVNNGIGLAGVGFNTRIMPIKVVPQNMLPRLPDPTSADIAKAIKYAADNGCRIINISLGNTDWKSQLLQETINYATLVKNALVVAAAGNRKQEIELFPASYENVLSVAASDENDRIYGSYNHFVDVMAPGKNIWTTMITMTELYNMHEGSSFAAPFVSGLAGLVMARFPQMTAQQVAEQIRVTADDVYHLQENAALAEKLGKGRVNAWKALQANIAQSVRLLNPKLVNKFGEYAFQNDTVSLVANFVNYLKPSTSALKATLSTSSPYVTIVKNTCFIRALNTLDSVTNSSSPFLVYLHPDIPRGEKIKFRVGFEDINYTDYQYFFVEVSDYYLNIHINEFSLTSAANGRIGMVNQANTEGIGIEFQKRQILKEAGLLVGINANKVANSIRINESTKADDFEPTQHIRFTRKDFHNIQTSAIFSDKGKIGLQIEQKIKGKVNSPHDKYILIDYLLINQSNQDIDSLYVGLYADWDIGGGFYNLADWDKEDEFGYVFQDNSRSYAGIKAIGGEPQYYPLEKRYNDGQVNLFDGFSEGEKFITLSNGLKRLQAGYNITGADVAHVVGLKLKNFKKGEVQKVTFVFLSGSSIEEMRQALRKAEIVLNPQSAIGKKPIIPTTLCWADSFYIKSLNAEKLNFYTKDNFKEPYLSTKELKVSLADTAKVFYITNADSLIESEVLAYQFKAHKAKANFYAIDSLNIADSTIIYFKDKSTKAVQWQWDFGDNTTVDTLPNPKHQFTKTGNYKVTLTITDSLGCQASYSKIIKIVRMVRSPMPTLPVSEIYACRTEEVKIRPNNGQNFKFYLSFPLTQAIHIGRDITIKDLNIKKLYITNIDSAFESFPIEVSIKRGDLMADFDYSPKADTITNERILFTNLSKGSLGFTNWEWDFGDGSKSKENNPVHRYNAQGIYKVVLKVTDFSGCTDSIAKIFRVGRKGQVPVIDNMVVCEGGSVVIAPSNGTKFNFYTSLPLTTPVYHGNSLSLTNLLENKIFYITNADSTVESDYKAVQITVNKPKADFYAPEEVLLYRANNIVALQDRSIEAVSWSWDMGDGSAPLTVQNPIYLYNKQGEYTITLTITDKYGCKAFTSKKIKVINRAKPPVIANIRVCSGTQIKLTPTGGAKFRFYEIYPSSIFAHEGTDWDLGKPSATKSYFVTCIDSLHESEATKVEVRVDNVTSRFEVSSLNDKNVLYAGDTLVFTPETKDGLFYQWYLGDGNSSNQKFPKYIYKNAGTYSVFLSVRNEIGCVAEGSQAIIIKPKSMIPPDVKVYIYPNPSEGDVKLEVNIPSLSLVHIEIYNMLGQKLESIESYMVKDEVYSLSLRNRDKGIYLLRINIGGEQFIRKIIYQ